MEGGGREEQEDERKQGKELWQSAKDVRERVIPYTSITRGKWKRERLIRSSGFSLSLSLSLSSSPSLSLLCPCLFYFALSSTISPTLLVSLLFFFKRAKRSCVHLCIFARISHYYYTIILLYYYKLVFCLSFFPSCLTPPVFFLLFVSPPLSV